MKAGTIYALSTGSLPAGLAVIRISGPDAGLAYPRLTGRALPEPRRATLATLSAQKDATPIDEGLALWFPGPASVSGEDVLEFHVHGGRSVVAALLGELSDLPGFRPADPGEFTRRAFENGKMDLTAAEGLADLIEAETEAQRAQAYRQFQGALGVLYRGWRERVIKALAYWEAAIDFSDEDIPESLERNARADIEALVREIENHLKEGGRGERLRDGATIAIIGPPNAGKSSLLNRLAQRDAAIVSETAGTTRDVIEVHLNLGGYPAVIADTAGLRDCDDAVEKEGVRRARERASHADLRIAVFDAADLPVLDPHTVDLVDGDTLVVVNKCDLGVPIPGRIGGRPVTALSVLTGAGFEDLLDDLTERVSRTCGLTEAPVLTRERHRVALARCRDSLARCLQAPAVEMACEDLRLAARSLGSVIGTVDVEDVLDVIFRDFCIGK